MGRVSRLTLHSSALGWFRVPKRCAVVYHVSHVAQNVGVARTGTQHKKITDHPQEAQGSSIGLSVCCKKDKRAKIKFYSLPLMWLKWTFYLWLQHAAQRLLCPYNRAVLLLPLNKRALCSRGLHFYFCRC